MRLERIKRTLQIENNIVAHNTPSSSLKLYHGKIKGSPKSNISPKTTDNDNFNFQETNILDLIRKTDNKIARNESPKHFLPTPFQNDTSSNYSSNYSAVPEHNGGLLGVKLPVNGLMTDLKGRSVSGIELTSPTKNLDINQDVNETLCESDSLLVRHYSLGHRRQWRSNCLPSSEPKENNTVGLKIKITQDNNQTSQTSCV